jgi:hypothetical protein
MREIETTQKYCEIRISAEAATTLMSGPMQARVSGSIDKGAD